jgi:hypothetical protein
VKSAICCWLELEEGDAFIHRLCPQLQHFRRCGVLLDKRGGANIVIAKAVSPALPGFSTASGVSEI